MTKTNPFLFIIAGPNGAGKSTFYNLILQEDPIFKNVDFINLDVCAKELAGENDVPENHIIEAGRIIRSEINDRLEKRKSFIYETTSAGVLHLKIMDEAKKRGYNTVTFFIGLEDAELSHLRVQQRIQKGGHSVPPDVIDRRFPNIIKHFPEMLARSDTAAVFDNSSAKPYQLIFFMDKENITVYSSYPQWLREAFKDRKTNKKFVQALPEEIHKLKIVQLQMAREIFGKSSSGR